MASLQDMTDAELLAMYEALDADPIDQGRDPWNYGALA